MSAVKILCKIDNNFEVHEVDSETYLYDKAENTYQRVQFNYQRCAIEKFSDYEESQLINHTGCSVSGPEQITTGRQNLPNVNLPVNNLKANTSGECSGNTSAVQVHRWDEKETLLLIDTCMERKNKLDNPKFVKKHIYKEISCFFERGYQKTALQCENRMKTLIAKYKKIMDDNNKTGNEPKYSKYFDLISTYIEDKPTTKPVGKCSSMGLAAASTSASSSKENANMLPPTVVSRNDEFADSTVPTKKPKRQTFRVRNTPRSEMLKWLKEYEKKNDVKEDDRKEFLRQQHEETTNLLKDILNKITD